MKRKRNPTKNKYEYLITKLRNSGVLDETHSYQIDVYHDDDCQYAKGVCNCHPVLRIVDLTLEASWDLSKLPKGVRAREAEIEIPMFGSEKVH